MVRFLVSFNDSSSKLAKKFLRKYDLQGTIVPMLNGCPLTFQDTSTKLGGLVTMHSAFVPVTLADLLLLKMSTKYELSCQLTGDELIADSSLDYAILAQHGPPAAVLEATGSSTTVTTGSSSASSSPPPVSKSITTSENKTDDGAVPMSKNAKKRARKAASKAAASGGPESVSLVVPPPSIDVGGVTEPLAKAEPAKSDRNDTPPSPSPSVTSVDKPASPSSEIERPISLPSREMWLSAVSKGPDRVIIDSFLGGSEDRSAMFFTGMHDAATTLRGAFKNDIYMVFSLMLIRFFPLLPFPSKAQLLSLEGVEDARRPDVHIHELAKTVMRYKSALFPKKGAGK
jgi:hypothetical protein